MKRVEIRKIIICLLFGIAIFTSGKSVFAGMNFSNKTHYWSTQITAFGSQSEYWHRTRQHSATVTKGTRISSQTRSANWVAVGRLFEFSGCNFYYNYW